METRAGQLLATPGRRATQRSVIVGSLIVATATIAALALWGPTSMRGVERPYEEAAYRLALGSPDPGAPWSEHPTSVFRLLRGWASIVGPGDMGRLRAPMLVIFLGSFLLLAFALSGATEGGRRRPGDVLGAVAFAFATYCSPLLLSQAFRLGPEAMALLGLGTLLAGASLAVESGRRPGYLAVGVGYLILGGSHSYGLLIAAAVAAAGLIIGASRPGAGPPGMPRSRWRWWAIAIAALPAALGAAGADFPGRWHHILDGYWAEPSSGSYWTRHASIHWPAAPLQGLWWPATSLVRDLPGVSYLFHLAVVVAVFRGMLLSRRPMAVLTSTALFLAASLLLGIEVVSRSAALIPHQAGCLFVLMMAALYFNAAAGPGWARLGTTLAALAILAVPVLADGLEWEDRGERVLRSASRELIASASGDTPVVFAGSRTYVLLDRFLPEELRRRSWVYIRQKGSRDSFPGLVLVPTDRWLLQEAWPAFGRSVAGRRIAYVRMEASQAVMADIAGWEIERTRTFTHPNFTIGDIDVMILRYPRGPAPDGPNRDR